MSLDVFKMVSMVQGQQDGVNIWMSILSRHIKIVKYFNKFVVVIIKLCLNLLHEADL